MTVAELVFNAIRAYSVFIRESEIESESTLMV